jgi:hypothetical protein
MQEMSWLMATWSGAVMAVQKRQRVCAQRGPMNRIRGRMPNCAPGTLEITLSALIGPPPDVGR